METHEEWMVTGDPGFGFPDYRFVWGGPYTMVPDPEGSAKAFVSKMRTWVDGPYLHRRTVTTTDWEEVTV